MRIAATGKGLAARTRIVPLFLLPLLLATTRPATGDRPIADDSGTDVRSTTQRTIPPPAGPHLQVGDPAARPRPKDPGHGRFDPALADPMLPTATGITSLTMESESGDYIGGGQHQFYTPLDGTFSMSGSRNHVAIAFSSNAHFWNLDFSAPNNASLAPGTYSGATRYPFNSTGAPGLSVYGDGRGCNSLTGTFQIKQITFNAQGVATSFWAKFEQHCEGGRAALTGDIRYNATVLVDLVAPSTRSVVYGQILGFTVNAVSLDSSHVALTATGLPAGASFHDDGSNTGSFAWTPTFDQIGLRAVVTFHGDNGHGGIDSAATQISVEGLTALTMASESGDYIGAGQQYSFTPADGGFAVSGNRNHVSITFNSNAHYWYLDFSAPNNAALAPGVYTGARRYSGSSSTVPGLSVSGDGRGCNDVTGSFQIKQITFDAQSNIASFWAKFEQHCEGGSAALTGDIRYNAKVALEVKSPATRTVIFNQPLSFQVSGTAYDSSHVTLTATGLPAGASFQDNGDNTGSFAWTPTFGQIGLRAKVTFRGDNGHGGVDSTITQLSVTGLTSLSMNSDPGDYVGQGQSYFYTPDDGSFRLSGDRSHVSVSFSSSSHSWTLDFAAPSGSSLTVGNYPNAARYPASGTPGLAVTGDYRSCYPASGSFRIKEIAFDTANNVTAFRATFEQRCGTETAGLTGEVRYNATVPVDLKAPFRIALAEGDFLSFPVTATSFDGNHVTLSAAGVPAGAAFIDRGDNTGRFDWTPGVHQQGSYLVIFRADNGRGGVDSVSTSLTVSGVTSLHIVSVPRDQLSHPQEIFFTPIDGQFTAQTNYHGGVSVTFRDSLYRYWSVDFAAPHDARLRRDIYEGAGMYPNHSPNQAGLQVTSSCYSGTGRFVVKQVEYGTGNDIQSFWATFDLTCSYGPDIHGEVRYNADVSLILTSPRTQTVNEGQDLSFEVRALLDPGVHTKLTSASLPRGATFLDHGDNRGTFDWIPDFDQDATYAVSFVGTDSSGVADSTWTRITVLNVNRSPVAKAGGPYFASPGVAVTFDGSGSSDPDQNALLYSWHFGDATLGTGVRPSHVYGGVGVYRVTLTVTDGLLSAHDTTHVIVGEGPAIPAIVSFSPTRGLPGTRVTIAGRNFVQVTAVTFNGLNAAFSVASAEQITATVPQNATSGPIAVRTQLGTATSRDSFTIAPPVLSACPRSPEYWSTHVSQWPVDALALGAVRYDQAHLLSLLRDRDDGDDDDHHQGESAASLDLARQLVAAKLNVLSQSDGFPVTAAIASADSIIGSRLIPFEVRENCNESERLVDLIRILKDYNNGRLNPECGRDDPLASARDLERRDAAAFSLSLAQNAPNPFLSSTRIEFSLPRAQTIRLSVFDLLGREVGVLMNGFQAAGRHAATWDGTDITGRRVDDGVYFYRLSTGGSDLVRKMILMRH